MDLQGKIALVTGGSGGIGREIALTLADKGANIGFTYSSNEEEADRLVKEIEEKGQKALAVRTDVSKADQVKEMVDKIEKDLGPIDILVNNAGITKDGLLIRMSEEDWDQVLDINLKGAFLVSKAVARPMMKRRYGKIINISSVVGVGGNVGQANYSASKAGLIGFSKSLAKELAGRGIRVNAVAPGFIETAMTDVLSEEVKEMMLNNIPLGKFGESKDVANLVAFLSAKESDYITGQVIRLDGGIAI